MAAEVSDTVTEVDSTPRGGQLKDQVLINALAQLLSWHILRQYFLSDNCVSDHEVNFSDLLRGR